MARRSADDKFISEVVPDALRRFQSFHFHDAENDGIGNLAPPIGRAYL
jgi:hypothetical protein